MSYPALNFPKTTLKLTKVKDQFMVWCEIRRKKLILTPEEWVRQHAIHFLIYTQKIPKERVISEHTLQINGQNRRCDIAVTNTYGKVVLIVECKASSVKLDEKVFLQTSNYVAQSGAAYFWMTNGVQHVFSACENPDIQLEDFPNLNDNYKEL